MVDITVNVLGIFRFNVKTTTPEDNGVIVNFQPIVYKAKITEKPNCFLIHLRARPVTNKKAWTWGVYDVEKRHYYPAEKFTSDFGVFSVESSPEELEPPTHVICIEGVTLQRLENGIIHFKKLQEIT